MLKEICTDTVCNYNEFEMKLTCGVKQDDCLSPLLFNFASEPIIRKSKEVGHKLYYYKHRQNDLL